jgi:hypothetical protein
LRDRLHIQTVSMNKGFLPSRILLYSTAKIKFSSMIPKFYCVSESLVMLKIQILIFLDMEWCLKVNIFNKLPVDADSNWSIYNILKQKQIRSSKITLIWKDSHFELIHLWRNLSHLTIPRQLLTLTKPKLLPFCII